MKVRQPPSTDQSQPAGSTSGASGDNRGRKFTRTEHEEVLVRVAELDRRGYNGFDIARMVGVTQPQACKYLAKIRRRYQEMVLDVESAKMAQLLDQFRDVRREAWEAWEITKGGAIRDMVGQLAQAFQLAAETGLPLPDKLTIKLRALPQSEFLSTILATLNSEAKVLGLGALGKGKDDGDAQAQAAKAALFDAMVAAAPAGPVPDAIEGSIEALKPMHLPEPTQPNGFKEQPESQPDAPG